MGHHARPVDGRSSAVSQADVQHALDFARRVTAQVGERGALGAERSTDFCNEAARAAEVLRVGAEPSTAMDLLLAVGPRTKRLRAETVLCAIGVGRDDVAREMAEGDAALKRVVEPWLLTLEATSADAAQPLPACPRSASPRVRRLHQVTSCARLSTQGDFRRHSSALRAVGSEPAPGIDGGLIEAAVAVAKVSHGRKLSSPELESASMSLARDASVRADASLRDALASDLSYLDAPLLRSWVTKIDENESRPSGPSGRASSRQSSKSRSEARQPTPTKPAPHQALKAAIGLARLAELPSLTAEAAATRLREVGAVAFEPTTATSSHPSAPPPVSDTKPLTSEAAASGALELYVAFGALAAHDRAVLDLFQRAQRSGADPVEVARGILLARRHRYRDAVDMGSRAYDLLWKAADDLAVEVSKGPDGELGRLAVILGALESRYAMGEPFAGSSERAADRGRFLDWLKGLRAFEESEDQAPVWLQNLLGRIDAFEAWLSRHESPRRALELSTRALARQPKDARMWDVRIQVGERLGEDISSWVLEAAQHTGEPRFRERARKLARGHGTSFVPFTGMVEGRLPSSLARGG